MGPLAWMVAMAFMRSASPTQPGTLISLGSTPTSTLVIAATNGAGSEEAGMMLGEGGMQLEVVTLSATHPCPSGAEGYWTYHQLPSSFWPSTGASCPSFNDPMML